MTHDRYTPGSECPQCQRNDLLWRALAVFLGVILAIALAMELFR